MLFAQKKKIDDHIVETLLKGPISTLKLISRIEKIRPNTTKEAIYAALRKLNNQEVVVINKSVVSLNLQWVTSLEHYALRASTNYLHNISLPGYFTSLKEGESIKYEFKNLNLLDGFANHVIITLLQTTAREHCFIYDFHNWVIYGREESETILLQTLENKERLMLLAIGSNTTLDKSIARSIRDEHVQCHVLPKKLFKKDNYSFVVIEDYVLEIIVNQEVYKEINTFFETENSLTDMNKKRLK